MKQFTRTILSFICITLFSSLYPQELDLSEIIGTYSGTLEIQNSLLQSRLQFDKDILYFEIMYSVTREQQKSGAIPEVISYPIEVVHSAVLKKINNELY